MPGWVSEKYVDVPPEPIPPVERARIVDEGKTFVDDVDLYLKLHPETPDIASVAQEGLRLRSATDNDDIPAIQTTTQALKRRMDTVSGFPDFLQTQIDKHKKDEIQKLDKAVSLAKKHQRFLRDQIAQNGTLPSTEALAALLQEYESALAPRDPDLSTLTNLNDRLKKIVSERGLTDTYNAAITELVKTDRNRFLLDGESTDWILVFNASGKAPHVARNIHGDIVFEGQQADACVLHSAAGKIEAAQVEDILSGYKLDTVRLDPSPCPEADLQSRTC